MHKREELKKNVINVHQRLGTDIQITAEEMDKERLNTISYDYLCRLEEAKNWVGEIVDVPDSFEQFENEMRKGVFLAEIAKHYSPSSVGIIFIDPVLQYRHTDNINFFLKSLSDIGLPKYFYFEVIDLYEKKNFPKVVYCIHALAHFLRSKGESIGIVSANGKIFNKEDIERMDNELVNIKMPKFDNLENDVVNRKLNDEESEDLEDIKSKVRAELLEEESSIIEANNREYDREELSVQDIITLKFRSFLYAKAFDDICYKKDVSVFSIRKFLFIFFKKSYEMLKEKSIDDYHIKIDEKLREIYNKEIYLEDIETRIMLIIQNKLDLYKIKTERPIIDDYLLKPIQDVLQYLQTNHRVLIELFTKVADRENFICSFILPLFNNVSGKKEEYLFIKLVMEMFRPIKSTQQDNFDLQNVNDFSYRMMINYFRISKEGDYFKKGLYAIVKNLDNIEIECNPTLIHKSFYDASKSLDDSLDNRRVSELYQTRLGVIRGVLKSIFDFIHSNVQNLPFILRYYLKQSGTKNFIKDFIFPFLLAGDVFDSEFKINRELRNKIYKLTNLILWFLDSLTEKGHLDASDESMSVYLPIADFLKVLYDKYQSTLELLVNVPSLEYYFQLESLNELVRVQKSMIYLPARVVNGLIVLIKENKHLFDSFLIDNLECIADESNIMLPFSFINSEWVNSCDSEEIALDNYIKNTKRKLIYLIKICKGRNIMDLILGTPTTEEKVLFEEEILYNKEGELNFDEVTLDELKDNIYEDLKYLEEKGIVSKQNLYGEILTLLAHDIIQLKFMSYERNKELKLNETTYNNLLAKEEYLDDKVAEYDSYIESYCDRIAVKKRNYKVHSVISKLNKESKYGSYYFTSTELIKAGILVQIFDIPDSRDLFFILVSNSPLVFALEIYINDLLISNPYNFRFEDILAMRRNKNEVFNVLDICTFNADNFIRLLNEKYIIAN